MESVLTGDLIHDATTNANLVVKRAKVDAAASADLIAAVTGKKIRVLALAANYASSTTLKLQSGGSTGLTGAMTGTSFVWPWNPAGWVQTASGEKLNAVMGSSVQLSGTIVYVEV
jgi:hypothetical protein